MGLPVRQVESCSQETTLAIRTVTHDDGPEAQTTELVFCPFRADSRAIAQCRGCGSFARVEEEPATLVCAREPPLGNLEASQLIAARRIWRGADSLARRTPVGALAGTRVVCASVTTTVHVAAEHLEGATSAGIVVVDEHGRPVGFITRERLSSLARRVGDATLGDCETTPFVSLPEERSLAEAIEHMVHRHLRVVVTADSSGKVSGVVLDVEILRWLGHLARGAER